MESLYNVDDDALNKLQNYSDYRSREMQLPHLTVWFIVTACVNMCRKYDHFMETVVKLKEYGLGNNDGGVSEVNTLYIIASKIIQGDHLSFVQYRNRLLQWYSTSCSPASIG